MRKFKGGATRNDDKNKFDFEAFIAPNVLEEYGKFMHSHRLQKDGKLRDGDNWQAGDGIPKTAYQKSLIRHTFHAWNLWRENEVIDPDTGKPENIKHALCAILFNSMGLLFEILKDEHTKEGKNRRNSL